MRIWQGDNAGGRLVEHATVSALDHGFTVADGVFETLKVVPAVAAMDFAQDRFDAGRFLTGQASPPDGLGNS